MDRVAKGIFKELFALPVERDEIATPDKIERWEYLKVISKSDEQYWR